MKTRNSVTLKSGMAVISTLALMGAFAAPASASPSDSHLDHEASTETESFYIPECLEALPDGEDKELCAATSITELSASELVDPADIAADPGVAAEEEAGLMMAAAAGSVRSRTYSQRTFGGAYNVTHSGRYYYDGSRAWVNSSYRGARGTQNCLVNYQVGVSISNINKSESGTRSSRRLDCQWTVRPLNAFAYSYGNWVTVRANGTP